MKNKSTLILTILLAYTLQAVSQSNDYAVRRVKDSLYIPWEMDYASDGKIWFTQRHGAIARLDPVTGQLRQMHFETEVVAQGEGGMLGFALHPNFPVTAEIFCVYNYNSGSGNREKLVVYNYLSSTDTLQYKSTIVDEIPAASIHNGSRLLIDNNNLYMTTGDAANQSLSQDLGSLAGKILRYNLDGSIPGDNPISGSAIWTWGHRNPQGLTMVGTKMVSSEHGPSTDDEINIIEKGRNYGWPDVHGYCNTPAEITFCNDSNVYEPAMVWTPTLAVSGIAYYNHGLFPQWQNKVFMTTLKDQTVYILEFNGTQDSVIAAVQMPDDSFGRVRDVLVAPDGKIYFSTSNSNSVNNKRDRIYEIYDPTPTNVSDLNKNSSNWIVSPVPATHEVIITSLVGNNVADMEVLDLNGRIIATRHLDAKNTTLIISDYVPGLYIIRIKEKGKPQQLLKIQKF